MGIYTGICRAIIKKKRRKEMEREKIEILIINDKPDDVKVEFIPNLEKYLMKSIFNFFFCFSQSFKLVSCRKKRL